tara:strand:+ start:1835 stop:2128 length:294 start_codon:yes stop_codon:yes gene_type:complete
MLIKLTEVHHNKALTYANNEYILREVFINPEHVVMIREDTRMQTLNEENRLPDSLMNAHRFTKLTINRGQSGTEIIVVGAPAIVEQSLNQRTQLLRG